MLCFYTKSYTVPSSYFITVVTYLMRNYYQHHERIVYFFYTTFLWELEAPKLLEKVLLFRNGDAKVLFILNFQTQEEVPKPQEVIVLPLPSVFMECWEDLMEWEDCLSSEWEGGLLMDREDSFTGASQILEGLTMEALLWVLKQPSYCLLLRVQAASFWLFWLDWLEYTELLTSLKMEGSAQSYSVCRSSPFLLNEPTFPQFPTFFSVQTDSPFPFNDLASILPDLTSLTGEMAVGKSMQFSLDFLCSERFSLLEGAICVNVLRCEVEVAMLCGCDCTTYRLAWESAITENTFSSFSTKSAPMYLQSLLNSALLCPLLVTPSSTMRLMMAISMLFLWGTRCVEPSSSIMLPFPFLQYRWIRSTKVDPSDP